MGLVLNAEIIGSHVAGFLNEKVDNGRNPIGSVHSVFSKVVNVELFDGALNGRIPKFLAVISDDAHPFAITCYQLPTFSTRFERGQLVYVREGFEFAISGSLLCVDVSAAKIWYQETADKADDLLIKRNGQMMAEMLQQDIEPILCGFAVKRTLSMILHKMCELRDLKADFCGMYEVLYPLLGMGPGLTPLGDDFISGYIVALWYLRDNEQDHKRLWEVSTRLATGGTTEYSRQQIAFAGQGLCQRSIFRLIQSLLSNRFDAGYLLPVLSIGASSGLGWAMGIATSGLGFDTES